MKNLGIAILLVSITVLFTACEKVVGDGPVVTENRNKTGFSGIDLMVSGNVYYTQSPEYKVEVRAQQNILEVLETYVSNGNLVIKYENDVRVRRHEDITIYISTPDMNSLRVSGSGNINTTNPINTSSMEMDISGSGNIAITNLTTNYVDANISGSGSINVQGGTATEEKLKISGSGNMDLQHVAAKTANTTTSGSGDTHVQVSERLNVTISGSGSVYYLGQPVINASISGSGKVRQQ
jgi:hypothetical protein